MNAADSSAIPTCEWRTGVVCQFPDLKSTVREYDGRRLCRAHAPCAGSSKTYDWMRPFVMDESTRLGTRDFSGCIFPAGPDNAIADYQFPVSTPGPARFVCRDCRFEGDVQLGAPAWREIDLSGSYFVGEAHIAGFARALTCTDSTFKGDVAISVFAPGTTVNLARCHFNRELELSSLDT